MIQTGAEIRFGIALVAGLLVGSFVSAAFAGRLQLQGFHSESEPLRYALGGLLMGFGGVTAMGCAVGQGLTGMSTLAPAAPMALISIAVGAVLAMRFAQSDCYRVMIFAKSLDKKDIMLVPVSSSHGPPRCGQ